MSRTLGTVVRGVRAPIFREGDNIVKTTVDTVLNALRENDIAARDGDVDLLDDGQFTGGFKQSLHGMGCPRWFV